ncbi:hypothetical protein L6452_03138 [Arctium lappa]|uniref:Uncharacterized protein n=1 Tax=Arctium lappa TaxID=4217 RepID=A0ACB9FM89_ARCLA|nr:hypothetical protein L6452_03138 [Arctium lappa]
MESDRELWPEEGGVSVMERGRASLWASSVVSSMGFLQWCLDELDGEAMVGKSMVQVKPRSLKVLRVGGVGRRRTVCRDVYRQ